MVYQRIDIAFEAGLIDADVVGDSESGYSLAAGARGYVSLRVELHTLLKPVDDAFGPEWMIGFNISPVVENSLVNWFK